LKGEERINKYLIVDLICPIVGLFVVWLAGWSIEEKRR
jgi:hypothetical protein